MNIGIEMIRGYNMDNLPKGLKILIDLRKGERVNCPKCNEGIVEAKGDCRTTRLFRCNKCDYRFHVD